MKLFSLVCDVLWYFGCIYYCSVQCWDLWSDFFSYSTFLVIQTGVTHRYEPPGLTVCSSIGVPLSVIESFASENNLLNESSSDYSKLASIGVNKSQEQSRIDFYLKSYMNGTRLEKVLADSLSYDQLFPNRWMRCSVDDFDDKNRCANLESSVVHSFQCRYSCFTFFHPSMMNVKDHKALTVPKGMMGSPHTMGAFEITSDQLFRSTQYGEIMRFVIDLRASQSLSQSVSAFARVIVHSRVRVSYNRNDPLNVGSDKFLILYLSTRNYVFLPPPYPSKCRVYPDRKEEHEHALFQQPRSRRDCTKACIAMSVVNNCHCWPPEIPYLSVSNLTTEEQIKFNVTMCNWILIHQQDNSSVFQGILEGMKNSHWTDIEDGIVRSSRQAFKKCYKDSEKKCASKCPRSCRFSEFERDSQISEWPLEETVKYSIFDDHLKNLTSCCVLVSVRYGTPFFTAYITKAKYQLVEILTYMGGLVSLWLGFTFIGTWKVLDKFVTAMYLKLFKKKNY